MALQFPDIDPVALSLGPLEIRWYALAYLAGFLLGWRYALFLAGKDEGKGQAITKTQIDDFLPWGIMGVIFGGRLGYVLFYQTSYFMQNPLEIFKIWHGGMSFHGGVLGMMVAMAAYSWHGKSSLLRLTDLVSCAAPIGLFFGRLANFVNGELFGRATDAPWGWFSRVAGKCRGIRASYEAVLEGLVLFGVLALLARKESLRNKPGVLTGIFLMGYGLARVIVEFFREPDIQLGLIADAVTMGQILSVPMVLCGLILFFYAGRKQAVS